MQRPYRRSALSERDLRVLDLERRWGPSAGAAPMKLAEARDQLGLDARSYALIVASLVQDPRAYEVDPRTVEAMRETRRQHRQADA